MRRHNSILEAFGLFFLLPFLLIFLELGGGLFIGLLPFIIPFAIFAFVGKLIDTINKQNRAHRDTQKTRKADTVTKKFVSNQERNQIDTKLNEYFKTNYKLPICADLALVTKNGHYSSFEDLYIAKNGETILSLDEYGDLYPRTYNDVLRLLKAFCKQKEAVLKAEIISPKIKESEKLSDAEKYIEKINYLNNSIPQEEISNGLNQTCDLLRQIDVGAKESKVDSKIDRLYDYYLPILISILDNYKSLLVVSHESQEFKDCEAQLIKTILLINEALKTINETMHEDDYMHLAADITTLQSLLKKDGLVKEGTIYESEGAEHDE